MGQSSENSLNENKEASAFAELAHGLTITSMPTSPLRKGEWPTLSNYELINAEEEVRVSISANPSNFVVSFFKFTCLTITNICFLFADTTIQGLSTFKGINEGIANILRK